MGGAAWPEAGPPPPPVHPILFHPAASWAHLSLSRLFCSLCSPRTLVCPRTMSPNSSKVVGHISRAPLSASGHCKTGDHWGPHYCTPPSRKPHPAGLDMNKAIFKNASLGWAGEVACLAECVFSTHEVAISNPSMMKHFCLSF